MLRYCRRKRKELYPITRYSTTVIFFLSLSHRYPNEHKYPPSAVRYTSRRNAGKQQSDSDIGNQYDDTKSPQEYATAHQAVGKKCDFDAQEDYDDLIISRTSTKYQNQTRTEQVIEEVEYDDTIKLGTGIKYQNQTRTKAVIVEECYDDIIKAGIGTRYQNQIRQTEGITAKGYHIVAHQY